MKAKLLKKIRERFEVIRAPFYGQTVSYTENWFKALDHKNRRKFYYSEDYLGSIRISAEKLFIKQMVKIYYHPLISWIILSELESRWKERESRVKYYICKQNEKQRKEREQKQNI